ncbi:MAG TPA: Stk1 family PASTA domain-containing Ser/Thr kinase [Candidatus Corynebacterium avicola]|uniref:non-specific serine/threonine protein kinase n=1 Tax=Candidatus Corynebacterium avicola TaxID=2838527 RepID=A0A9D1UMF0_9CORY|nr:Stk1 family PASTA domain-containing Ser/Thr kinase [Candidatus Corynebacterium avicola]
MEPLRAGDLLDNRYRIGETIAHGGMSVVYHCVDTRLDRDLAAKVMDPEYAAEPAFRARFEREARAVARLNHPCLVNVFDQGVDHTPEGDHVFLIMELVPGGTLRELLRERGPMPPHAACAVMGPVLEALDLAHEAGMVHRDVKPDNVLIREDHQVKLADFGLVRAAHQDVAAGAPVIGTAAYLAPEQVRGRQVGPAGDVYAAGILLFELLTGRTPFSGATPDETAVMRLDHDVPPPSSLISGVPAEIDELVLRATRRAPEERFADGGEFLVAVEETKSLLRLPDFRVPAPTNTAVRRALAGSVISGRLSWDDEAMATSMFPQQPEQHTAETNLVPPVPAPVPDHQEDRPPEPEPGYNDEPDHAPASGTPAPRPSKRPGLTNRSPVANVVWGVLLIGLIVAVAVAGWWVTSGRYGEVPEVLGQDASGAQASIEAAGFASTISQVYSDDEPADEVTGTDPGAGERVPRGDEVAVLVSQGRPTVPQPGAADTLESYQKRLEDRTLTWTVGEEVYSDDVETGDIAELSPGAGEEVDTGTEVTIQLSKGAEPVTVPDVSGMSEDQARRAIERAGLTVGEVTENFDEDVDGGDAIGTDVDAGKEIPGKSPVTLVLSNAVTVPDLEGKSAEKAAEELRELGLSPSTGEGTSDTSVDAGDIASQEPSAGTRIDPAESTTVTLHESTMVRVPIVIGRSVDSAREILEDEGLEVEVDGRENGRVITQSPGPTSRAALGDTVTLRTI